MEKSEEVGFRCTDTSQRAKGLVAKSHYLGCSTFLSLSFLFQTEILPTSQSKFASMVVKSIVFANLDLNLRSGRYQLFDFVQIN